MNYLAKFLKYSSLTAAIYDRILESRCKSLNAYIFVATTGRSGSESLSKVFHAVKGAISLHEPYPIMYNDYPPGTDKKKYFDDLFYKIKRINIKRSAAGHSYYVETNHQFIKNFVSQAIECFGNKIRIIHLVRDPVRTAASFYSMDSIPGRTKHAQFYLLDPNDDDNIIKIADLFNSNKGYKHALYRCLWYWYEVETRIKLMKQRFSHVDWYTLNTNDLNDMNELLKMFRWIDLPVDLSKLSSLVGVHANTKLNKKTKKIDLEQCKVMNDKLLEKMEARFGKRFWL